MAILASDAEQGRVYRTTRGELKGSYYTVPSFDVPKLVKRLRKRGSRIMCRDMSLLADAVRHPERRVFLWHLRGTDPFTGDRFEMTRTVLLSPDTRLRRVKSKPGYK
jgi:hypothetical protein